MKVELTEEEFELVQYCIEFISANERNFSKDGEKTLKSIAEKFNAEYNESANTDFPFSF